MRLSKSDILTAMSVWLKAWDDHCLDGVMALLHDDIVFDNWTGVAIIGKKALQRAWSPWFLRHGNFQFIAEDIFIDVDQQKVLFQWRLQWPSLENSVKGKLEVRSGVDVLHFRDGKIYKKYSYCKTTLIIDGVPTALCVAP